MNDDAAARASWITGHHTDMFGDGHVRQFGSTCARTRAYDEWAKRSVWDEIMNAPPAQFTRKPRSIKDFRTTCFASRRT